jgi:hypothetical protein
LLRTFCLYGVPNASLSRVAAEAKRLNLASMSGPAFFWRVVKGERFLASVFEHLLEHACDRVETWKGLKLFAVDATALCGPGAIGTDQRLHVAYDLGAGRPVQVDLTGREGGETFRRFLGLGPGSLVLADQGYGYGPGIVPLLKSKANVLVRFNFYSIRLLDSDGLKITPERAESMLSPDPDKTIEFEATLPGWDTPVRIFGARNPEGEGVWLLTNLPASELAASEVRGLYSRRWQIENFLKRMKSLSGLDSLQTRAGPTARSWIWIKLIIATLAVLVGDELFPPWGHPEAATAVRDADDAERSFARGEVRPDKYAQETQVQTRNQLMGSVRPGAQGNLPGSVRTDRHQGAKRPSERTKKAKGKNAQTGNALETMP